MKCSEWDKEISKLTDAELTKVSNAMADLLSWKPFKDSFTGIRTVQSIVGNERMTREYKHKGL